MPHQPFSYQTLASNCWVTSVTNGLLHLFDGKKKIPGFALRLLNTPLTDDGVGGGGKGILGDWLIALKATCERCGLEPPENLTDEDRIRCELPKLGNSHSVAIVDVRSGSHAILLFERADEGWYYGFDPDWQLVKESLRQLPVSDEYRILTDEHPKEHRYANILLSEKHLFRKRFQDNRPFAMGALSSWNVTIISRGN